MQLLQPRNLFRLPSLLALLCISLGARCNEASPLILQHLTTLEGLPQGTVMATLQDSQGFVWLGTEDGLLRFDGHDLHRYAYSRSSKDGLPGNFVNAIAEDAHGDLWLAIEGAGLAQWHRRSDSFTAYRHDASNPASLSSDAVRTVLIDTQGRVWAGTFDSGVNVLVPGAGSILHLSSSRRGGDSLSDDRIQALMQDRRGDVWIGARAGLDRWRLEGDTLTSLPNRQQFINLAERAIAQAAGTGEGVAFIYLDLNGFKRINDTFGHFIGDLVLKEVATTLSRVLDTHPAEPDQAVEPDRTTLARLGGDEFVFLVKTSSARERALQIAADCCTALDQPIIFNNLEFLATPSIGVAVYPEDGADVEALLKHADIAMYQPKVGGIPKVATYTAAMSARLRDWLDLESRLRRAVQDDQLALAFQPKVRLSDNVIVGVEALARWYDADLGEVPPTRFIQVAEESGIIVDLGAWLLLFGDPARTIELQTARFNIPSSAIEVEITEAVFVNDSHAGRSSVERIRQKIDRSFVRNVDRSGSDAAIVNAIMSLANTLNLRVAAEGSNAQASWRAAARAGAGRRRIHARRRAFGAFLGAVRSAGARFLRLFLSASMRSIT